SYSMTRGLIDPGEQLVIISKIREGRIFIDGPHHTRDVRMGARVAMRRSDEPLSLLGFPRAERREHFERDRTQQPEELATTILGDRAHTDETIEEILDAVRGRR